MASVDGREAGGGGPAPWQAIKRHLIACGFFFLHLRCSKSAVLHNAACRGSRALPGPACLPSGTPAATYCVQGAPGLAGGVKAGCQEVRGGLCGGQVVSLR